MTTITFDTHVFVKKLVAAGMPEPQAEAVTTLVREAQDGAVGDLATRRDLGEVKRDLKETELRLETRIEAARTDILRWMFVAVVGQTTLIVGLLKFFGH